MSSDSDSTPEVFYYVGDDERDIVRVTAVYNPPRRILAGPGVGAMVPADYTIQDDLDWNYAYDPDHYRAGTLGVDLFRTQEEAATVALTKIEPFIKTATDRANHLRSIIQS